MRTLSAIPLLTSLLALAACASSPPPMRESDRKGEVVPANAAGRNYSEGRMPSEGASPPPAPPTSSESRDPGPTTPTIAPPPAAGAAKGDKTGRVGKDECDKSMDKYIDLVAQGMGMAIPPELRSSVRAQTSGQAGGDPCGAATTRPTQKQYKCAMSASTKDAWEACMK